MSQRLEQHHISLEARRVNSCPDAGDRRVLTLPHRSSRRTNASVPQLQGHMEMSENRGEREGKFEVAGRTMDG